MSQVLRCRAVLFDCDGVLVDSDVSVLRSWRTWSERLGLDPDVVEAAIHGRRSTDTVAHFVEPLHRATALALIDELEADDATSVTPIPGAADLLTAIPAELWAVVTSGVRALATARLTAAGMPAPAVLVAADDVSAGKPDPEGYLSAARGLGVPPPDCIVLEDAPAGVRAARAAGVGHVIGVGGRDFGDDRPDAWVADLRRARWTGDGLELDS